MKWTALTALLIAFAIAAFAIWKMQHVDDVDVHLGKTIEVRARGSSGEVGLVRQVVGIGPYVSSLTDPTLMEIRDRVNACHPEKVQDVYSYYHQNPGAGGEYAVLLLCVPGKNTKGVSFDVRKIADVHLDLPNKEQYLRQFPEKAVILLLYEGGKNEIDWLERTDSNVMNIAPLPPKTVSQ
jgi:hypothetical protein